MDGNTFELKWDILEGYFIRGFDIVYSGLLYGGIHAQNNIIVKWWWVLGWTIVAENGSIGIENSVRIQSGTRIEAINGKIIIKWNLNNATIIASNIEVQWTATNSFLLQKIEHEILSIQYLCMLVFMASWITCKIKLQSLNHNEFLRRWE